MIPDVKKRDDAQLFQLNRENRDSLVPKILEEIGGLGKRFHEIEWG
jgi:hypothetical protein